MKRITLAALTWLAGLAPVAAQTTWETDPHHPPIGISGPYTRADHGQFSADLDPDVVVLANGTPIVLNSPAIHDARFTFPAGTTTSDIAVLRNDLSAGERDEVLTIGTTGLLAWSRDGDGQPLTSRGLGSSAWIGVERLASYDAPNKSDRIYLGSFSSPNGFVVLIGPDTPFEDEFTRSTIRPAIDLVVFQATASEQQVAMTTSSGVLVYDLAGNLEASFSGVGGKLVAATQENGLDALVWFRTNGSDDEYIVIANDGQSLTAATAVSLGPIGVSGVAAGDLDGDGDDDLVINHKEDFGNLVFRNTGGVFVSHFVVQMSSNLNSYSLDNLAEPVLADFDKDSDLDLALAVAGDDEFELFLRYNPSFNRAEHAPTYNAALSSHLACPPSDFAKLKLAFQKRTPIPAWADHIELILWEHDFTAQSTNTTSVARFVEPVQTTNYFTHEFTTNQVDFDQIILWCCRYVSVDANDNVTGSLPAHVGGVCRDLSIVSAASQRWGAEVVGAGIDFEFLVSLVCPASPGSYPPDEPDDDTNNVDVKPLPDEGNNNDGNGNNGGGGG